MNHMKKIIKIITFYDDGTFSESIPNQVFPLPIETPWTNPLESKTCSKCGLKLEAVMGYVCTNYPCPTGLAGVSCSSGEVK